MTEIFFTYVYKCDNEIDYDIQLIYANKTIGTTNTFWQEWTGKLQRTSFCEQ